MWKLPVGLSMLLTHSSPNCPQITLLGSDWAGAGVGGFGFGGESCDRWFLPSLFSVCIIMQFTFLRMRKLRLELFTLAESEGWIQESIL